MSNPITLDKIFQQLAGTWQLERKIHSTCHSLPSGTFTGKATFRLQTPTAPHYQQEYYYQEKGHFTSIQQTVLYSQQTYIYRLQKQPNQITIWPTDAHPQALSAPLHVLETLIASDNHYHIQGTPHHCRQDYYQVAYQFHFLDENLTHWRSTYTVKGPTKDYRIENHYTRVDDII